MSSSKKKEKYEDDLSFKNNKIPPSFFGRYHQGNEWKKR
jgi:hypothetical protein